jgi:hypothetical protein
MAKQAADGAFSGNGYEQGLASLAICEAYALTLDPALKGAAQRAVNSCVAWQHQNGGWRYTPRTAGDTSVTGWFVQAIKTGQAAGLNVPNATLAGITNYLDAAALPDGSGYGYMAPTPTPTMTAVGLLSRQYMGWGPKTPGIVKGTEYLLKVPPSPNFRNIYYYYYATQFMHHQAPTNPAAWDTWHTKLRDTLIDRQDQGTTQGREHQKGSWSNEGDAWGGQLGRLGYTSLAILNLEVYYRHVPLYYPMAEAKKE